MDEATINGITIYDGTSSTWSGIQANLTNWDPTVLSTFQSTYINNGGRVILPANADVPIDSITDYGAFVTLPGGNFGSLLGATLGSKPTVTLSITIVFNDNSDTAPEPGTAGSPQPGDQTEEPIQLWQGKLSL